MALRSSTTHLQYCVDRLSFQLRNKGRITERLPPMVAANPSKFKISGCSMKLEMTRSNYQENHLLTDFDSGINKRGILKNDIKEEALIKNVAVPNERINRYVETINSMLDSLGEGAISVSAYDIAWVALIEDVNGSGSPQFPSTLEWIINNQLPDGSWGDTLLFSAYDRILSTLICVIALKTWKVHPDKYDRGISYLKESFRRLEDENADNMGVGFEVILPTLLDMAQNLDIEVPNDSSVLKDIYSRRDLKLSRIPMDVIHNVPSTLLFSLEGIPGLNWEKMLKLQNVDGSFLASPSSTAYAFMQTKDENCLRYLNRAIQVYNGAVPTLFPIDFFERLWLVDRLQRLGISRYFKPVIKKCVDHIHRNWNERGISWTGPNSKLPDIDDTSMGFRFLRQHGYHVSADVFKHFEKGGEFFCYHGESSRSVTALYNLYRASQVRYPGEEILEDADKFVYKFLREREAANEFKDKWIISKDIAGEVGYGLQVRWYASLPRVESRFYVEQYGGDDDAWISKTLYRLHFVNNNLYLELAKLDFNECQALHYTEWEEMQEWYQQCNLKHFGISKKALLLAYFLAAASIFEPERSVERMAWAKTTILLESIESLLNADGNFSEQREAFVNEFKSGYRNGRTSKTGEELVKVLLETIRNLSLDASRTCGRDISPSLHDAWEKWLLKWEMVGDRHQGEAELLVRTMNLTSGCSVSEETLSHHSEFEQLCNLANRLCGQLRHYQKQKELENGSYDTTSDGRITTPEIESGMEELVQLVFQNTPEGIESNIKQTFLAVVKSFYYTAFCHPETIDYHIGKVLFERVQ